MQMRTDVAHPQRALRRASGAKEITLAAMVMVAGCASNDVAQGHNLPSAPPVLGAGGTNGFGAPNASGTGGAKAPTVMNAPVTSGAAGIPGGVAGAAKPPVMMLPGTGGLGMGTGGMAVMMKPPGTGGGGAPMMPPMVMVTSDPMIPAISGTCPSLETGNTTGVDGQVQSGPMPSSATAPMLLYWHGTGSTSGEYAFMAAAIANGVVAEGGVIVSFQGSTNKGDCSPSGTAIFCTGDFDVMDQYVACAVMMRNVDPHRIYTAGCSAGGLMATAMAMQRSQYIAAAAPNSGGVTFGGMFSSNHTPALMAIHGAPGMDVVGVDFSQTSATAEMLFKQHGGLAIDCNTGGGHCGGGGLAGDAWTFMQAHPFGVAMPWTTLPMGFSTQCKIQ